MNSQPNLTTKIQRLFLIAALAICPFIAFQSGMAQETAVATLTSGGNNSISIAQNGNFILTLGVTTNFVSGGYTVFFRSTDGSGLFSVSAPRTNLSPIIDDGSGPRPVFNDPTTANPFAGTSGVLNPSNGLDLGYTGDQVTNQPAGTFNLQSIQFNALNAAPGVYHVFLDTRSVMTSRTGGLFTDVNMTGNQFTITVVPEPATIGLAVMGGAMLLVVARRKLASRA